jgi:hypothetical protein
MSPLDTAFHFLGFAAPALFVALAVAFGARWVGGGAGGLPRWRQFAMNFTVGVAALAFGLWHFGVDGKMASYAGLVAAVATAQWLGSRGWKA